MLFEVAGYAHLRFELPLHTHLEHVRTACTAIYHLKELAHENARLKEARPMLDIQDEICMSYQDRVQGELVSLMEMGEAEHSFGSSPIVVSRAPFKDFEPERGVQPNDCHSYVIELN